MALINFIEASLLVVIRPLGPTYSTEESKLVDTVEYLNRSDVIALPTNLWLDSATFGVLASSLAPYTLFGHFETATASHPLMLLNFCPPSNSNNSVHVSPTSLSILSQVFDEPPPSYTIENAHFYNSPHPWNKMHLDNCVLTLADEFISSMQLLRNENEVDGGRIDRGVLRRQIVERLSKARNPDKEFVYLSESSDDEDEDEGTKANIALYNSFKKH